MPNAVVILDEQQHTLRIARLRARRVVDIRFGEWARERLWRRLFGDRQNDRESGPVTRRTVDGNVAERLLDDAIGGCETQARSLANRLRGEEGLEQMRQR